MTPSLTFVNTILRWEWQKLRGPLINWVYQVGMNHNIRMNVMDDEGWRREESREGRRGDASHVTSTETASGLDCRSDISISVTYLKVSKYMLADLVKGLLKLERKWCITSFQQHWSVIGTFSWAHESPNMDTFYYGMYYIAPLYGTL